MKKTMLTSFLAATTLLTLSLPAHSAHADEMGRLQTQGKEIQKDGQNFQLKGVNAGNVFTTEKWMGGYPSAANINEGYKAVFDDIQSKVNSPEKAHQILDRYAHNRWDDQDFQNVKDMGCNTIRLPINYINLTNYQKGMNPKDVKMRDHAFDEIDQFVAKAQQHGLYVILDMHGAPNSQNAQEHSGETQGNKSVGNFWNDPDAQGKTKEIWYYISQHYKNNNAIAGYDILNEPKGPAGHSDDQVQQFYKDTLKTIRGNGDNHIAFLEAVWDPQNMKDPQYFGKNNNNIVYEYHNYPYNNYAQSHKGIRENFDNKINSINKANYNVPSYMGEFNGNAATNDSHIAPNSNDFKYILKKMNENRISWSIWNYDKEGINQPDSSWGVENFKGIQTDINSNDFGKKEQPQKNEAVFNAVKEAAQQS